MSVQPAPTPARSYAARVPAFAWTLLFVVVAAVVYGVIASGRAGPFIDNDEFIYGNTARNLANGDGFTWRGVATPVRSLYEVVIAPAWLVSEGHSAYTLAKLINVVCICCTAIPTWLMGRELLRSRLALLPPALVLLGGWMEMSGKLMTESLALPAAAFVSYATLMVVRRGSVRWLALALALCVLAGLARSQLAALLALPGAAMTVDLLRRPRPDWGPTLRERRVVLAVSWFLLLVGLVVAIGPGRSLLGSYASFFDRNPGTSALLAWTGQYLLNLVLLVGVAPFVALLALALTKPAWRDADTGALLSLTVSLVVIIALQGGWLSGTEGRVLERYLIYAVPLVLVGGVLAFGRVNPRAAVVAGVGTVLGMFLTNPPSAGTEGSTLQTLARRFLDFPADLSGTAGMAGIVTLVIAVPTVGALVLAHDPRRLSLHRWRPQVRWLLVTAALGLSITSLVLANQSLWHIGNQASSSISDALGGSSDWTDDRAGPPSYVVLPAGVAPLAVLWTEFFNGRVRNVMVPAGNAPPVGSYGPTCQFDLTDEGSFAGSRGCGPLGRSFVFFLNVPGRVTLRRQVGAERKGVQGLAVQVTGGPRLLGLREDLCSTLAGTCQAGLLNVWAPAPGRVVLRFRGGAVPQTIGISGRTYALPAARRTTIALPVGMGYVQLRLEPSWNAISPGIPVLESARLTADGAFWQF